MSLLSMWQNVSRETFFAVLLTAIYLFSSVAAADTYPAALRWAEGDYNYLTQAERDGPYPTLAAAREVYMQAMAEHCPVCYSRQGGWCGFACVNCALRPEPYLQNQFMYDGGCVKYAWMYATCAPYGPGATVQVSGTTVTCVYDGPAPNPYPFADCTAGEEYTLDGTSNGIEETCALPRYGLDAQYCSSEGCLATADASDGMCTNSWYSKRYVGTGETCGGSIPPFPPGVGDPLPPGEPLTDDLGAEWDSTNAETGEGTYEGEPMDFGELAGDLASDPDQCIYHAASGSWICWGASPGDIGSPGPSTTGDSPDFGGVFEAPVGGDTEYFGEYRYGGSATPAPWTQGEVTATIDGPVDIDDTGVPTESAGESAMTEAGSVPTAEDYAADAGSDETEGTLDQGGLEDILSPSALVPSCSSCTSFSFSVMGKMWVLPGAAVCDHLETLKVILAWAIGIFTAVSIFQIVVRPEGF